MLHSAKHLLVKDYIQENKRLYPRGNRYENTLQRTQVLLWHIHILFDSFLGNMKHSLRSHQISV